MKFSKSLTNVTPFSKTLTITLFILLTFTGFYLGNEYKDSALSGKDLEIKKLKQELASTKYDLNLSYSYIAIPLLKKLL